MKMFLWENLRWIMDTYPVLLNIKNDFYAFITIEEGEAEVETTRQALVRVDLKNKKFNQL